VDLHARVLATWWTSQVQQQQRGGVSGNGTSGPAVAGGAVMTADVVAAALTEAQAFELVCPQLLPGCTSSTGCCAAFRNFSLTAAQAGDLAAPTNPFGFTPLLMDGTQRCHTRIRCHMLGAHTAFSGTTFQRTREPLCRCVTSRVADCTACVSCTAGVPGVPVGMLLECELA
jgi:hypothetical protein